HQRPIQCLAYSPDGRLLASATGDRPESELRVWDANTGKELRRLDIDTLPVSQLRFLPGSKLLAAVERLGGRVHVWETATSAEVHQLGGDRAAFSAFSPDGSLLALWQRDSVRVWDVAESQLTAEVRAKISAQDL